MAISKVVVVDGNNLIVRIDRGVAGRGVTDVEPIEIDGSLYLVFTFSDGTTETVGPVGTIQYIGQTPIVVTGSTISLSTVPVNLGGTGQTTANAGFNALAPTQTGNAGKYLKTDGTNSAWDLLDISTADITGVLPIANGGTNASTASGARTNLGLGTIATQDASAVAITGGSITGITDLAVADGGTGASTAAGARINLNAADQALTLTAGTGLSGGGDLTANRSFSIANTGVTAASYGAASKTLTATVNAQGQLTALADTDIAISNTQISGLGTMSTQNANAVAITGGSITGITDLAVADGGTGASTAADARTNLGAAASATTISAGTGLSGGGDLTANRTLSIANTAVTAGSYGTASDTLTATVNAQGQLTALAATPIAISNTQISGLGTMSTQNSNAVTITGGSITGITDLAIADGGTGASNAADARSNLGLGTAAVLNAGVANGVATLDAGGTVPLSQIPASIQGGVSYQGAWNASTNTPTLTSSVGTKGHYYVVSVAGNTNLNGVTDWLVGDWAIYNGTAWEKIDNTDQVASVNGYTGVVVLTNTDVGAPPTSLTISAGTGLSGGGNLTTNRTLSIANTAVSAGSYGTASAVPSFTVNGQGQLTAASDVTIAITNTQVSGLGTMSTQNANSVSITGGSITGITDLAIADGGTGASTAGGALTNLGAIGTITSTDGSIVVTPSGTTVDLAVSAASPASTLLTQVRNTTGATLTKGTVVYISGATGQIATVSKAIATGDATSAQTLGMITSNLANNSNGYVTVFGLLEDIDTSSYTDGAQLYLSGTTAGAVTATKPSAPTHLVYVAVVEYAHPTQGKLLVKVQNGYELDEIHDVSIVSPVTGQTLVYNATTDLWVNNTVSLTAGVNGTLPIANGGTGQTTANAAFNALAPSQTGNSGKYLTTDGSNTSWATNPLGTVTSVSGTGTVNGLTLTGTVTTSGSLTLGGTLSGIPNSALTNSSITIGGTAIALGGSSNALANDITINSVTVGRGAGSISTNTAVGLSALVANSGTNNTAVGNGVLSANTSGGANTGIGDRALNSSTTATFNAAIGVFAGRYITGSNNTALGSYAYQGDVGGTSSGGNNVAVGYQSLYFNTTASNNTAVGYQAMFTNQTGTSNVAVGYQSLYANTGSSNTAVGIEAMVGNQGGNDNSAFGQVALGGNISGSYNVAVGKQALRQSTTASLNTAVGYQSQYSGNGSQNTSLGTYAMFTNGGGTGNTVVGYAAVGNGTLTGNNNTAVGDESLYSLTSGSGNIALGFKAGYYTTSDAQTISIGYAALYNNTTGGGGSYNIAIGYNAQYYGDTGSYYNIAIGAYAHRGTSNATQTGRFNTAIGNPITPLTTGSFVMGEVTSGSQNVALGNGTLGNLTSGNNNTAVGFSSLQKNTTASYSTAVGYLALYSNTASYNTAVGGVALTANTTGAENTAVGMNCLDSNISGSYNTAMGVGTLQGNTTSSYNSAFGHNALCFNTASYNTAVGYQAGYLNTTGTSNVAVGYQALFNNNTNENVAVGNGALFTVSTINCVFNVAVGHGAAYFTNNSLGGVVAIGNYALNANTTGIANVAVGSRVNSTTTGTLVANTEGSYNTALGAGALSSNVLSNGNTAVGYQAGFSSNGATNGVFLGFQAGVQVTTGSQCIYIGDRSGSESAGIIGANNIGIGAFAGSKVISGSNNVFLGQQSGREITTGSGNSILGSFSGNQGGLDIRTASNNIVLSDGNGNVGARYDKSGSGLWDFFQKPIGTQTAQDWNTGQTKTVWSSDLANSRGGQMVLIAVQFEGTGNYALALASCRANTNASITVIVSNAQIGFAVSGTTITVTNNAGYALSGWATVTALG